MSSELFGIYVASGLGIVFVVVVIYLIWKYRPVSIIADMIRDFRELVVQVVLMYSNKPSIFAKKRVESGAAFWSALTLVICFIWYKKETITILEFTGLITLLFTVGGWNVYQIQKEKKMNAGSDNSVDTSDSPDKK
jgi:hypothetical protein